MAKIPIMTGTAAIGTTTARMLSGAGWHVVAVLADRTGASNSLPASSQDHLRPADLRGHVNAPILAGVSQQRHWIRSPSGSR